MNHFHQKPMSFVQEVNINVMDLDRSLDFYQNIIGLKVLDKQDRVAVLTADGRSPLVTLEQPEDVIPKPRRTSGLYHFAILLPTRADLAVFLQHLIETGYPFGASDHYVSEALYIDDPDGNGIEVYRDRPASEWTWQRNLVNMATEPLDAQGILAESNAEWKGIPEGTIMGHLHLHVGDLAKSEEFYTKGLGFDVVAYYPHAAFLSTGGYHHHIAINMWQGVGAPTPPENSVGLKYYKLILPSEEARNKIIEQVKQIGAQVHVEKNYYVTHDPAGNRIHLHI